MGIPQITVNKTKLWKCAGYLVSAAYVVAYAFGFVPAGLDGQIIAILTMLGLWVLPSPAIRTTPQAQAPEVKK